MVLNSVLCLIAGISDSLNQFTAFFSNPYTSGVSAVVGIISLISLCVIFSKAGRGWWEAMIPIYSIYVMCKISKISGWNFLWIFVPIANCIFCIILIFKLAATFNKGVIFSLGIIFFPVIFLPILAFGGSRYIYSGEGYTILE